MKIRDNIRKVVQRHGQVPQQDHARVVDEKRMREQADAWKRPGGPVDAGFVA